jgi:two-component system response regulator YesN
MADAPLRVVLVDDEPLAREHVRRSVDWEALGLTIVGEASDGQEALHMIGDLTPALALVDINIPYVDGLAVSERVRIDFPECKVVVLTGFDDFENVRRALRAGVVEYVLKPLASDELTSALVRARDRYQSESRQRVYRSQLEGVSQSAPESPEEVAFAALIRDIHHEVGESAPDLPDLAQSSRIAVLRIDQLEDRWPDVREQNRWHEALREVIRSCSSSDGTLTAIGPDGFPAFIADSIDICTSVIECCRAIAHDRFDFTVSVGISTEIGTVSQARARYLEALVALRERFFSGPGHTGIAPAPERVQRVVVEAKSDLTMALRMGDLAAIERYLDDAFARVNEHQLDSESVYLMAVEMAAAGAQFLTELDRSPDDIMDETGTPWTSIVRSKESVDDLRAWLSQVFGRILEEATQDRRFRTFRVVELAVTHISEHFADAELSLRSIADACNVNPTYLSKVFKVQTGHSVIEYLRSVRLKKAEQLMKERRDVRVNEIAEQCGFSDPLYFSKVFKTAFGVSPRKFMRL